MKNEKEDKWKEFIKEKKVKTVDFKDIFVKPDLILEDKTYYVNKRWGKVHATLHEERLWKIIQDIKNMSSEDFIESFCQEYLDLDKEEPQDLIKNFFQSIIKISEKNDFDREKLMFEN